MTKKDPQIHTASLPETFQKELEDYQDWIAKYRRRQIGDIKMQKIRLQLGTYAQRQEGVQMQRIKFPGGSLTSGQLRKLADVSDRFASGFIHFTTREDAQLYYIKLEECPDMMRELASAGITTREACGNTVRNITCCHYSGMSPNEPFDITPYSHELFRFLVRNKYNQVMGRKFKIAFEGCDQDHAGMRFHDLGFQAVVKTIDGKSRRGFRTYIGGGLGATPMLGHLYSEFLPEEEMFNLSAACVRIFDRHGERKNRMAARMKYLIRKIGWDKFKELLDEERKIVNLSGSVNEYLIDTHQSQAAPTFPSNLPENPADVEKSGAYQAWMRDSVMDHKFPGYKGVHVRLRLGDLVSDKARKLADIAEKFAAGELRITIDQNLFLGWVPAMALPAVYSELAAEGLAEAGTGTLEDTTTCPGADTCRLGITSAKGMGSAVSEAMNNGMSGLKELSRDIRIKVSGCPNGCAQHHVAQIGFQGAALSKDGKTIPAHEVFVGGGSDLDNTTIGERLGKIPAKNGPKAVAAFLELYEKEKQEGEKFNQCMTRLGKERLKRVLEPFMAIPSFDEDPEAYKDWGHENEKFAIRTGIKGECAGAPVQEKAPMLSQAKERLEQAEAFLAHKEYENARIEAVEAMAQAVRVPLYANLIDPFTTEQALWEFENVFARAGRVDQEWVDFTVRLEEEMNKKATQEQSQTLIAQAQKLISVSEKLFKELTQPRT